MQAYSRQTVTDADVRAVTEALSSPLLTTGPRVQKYEGQFAHMVEARHAVATSSGTAALHCAYHAIGLGPGDEVIVPALTFVATASAARLTGATVVLADVDPGTLLVDLADVRAKITKKTAAVVAVDYAGQPCDYWTLKAICEEHDVRLVADACHSLGAVHDHTPVGSLADVTCFSTHAVKAITTCGEGGMVTTDDAALAERVKTFRDHGRCLGKTIEAGLNYRLSDVAAAMGMSQLPRLNDFIMRRQGIAHRYDEAFEDIALKRLPNRTHAYHLYVIRCEDEKARNGLRKHLAERGIGSQVHYESVSNLLAYKNLRGTCPVAERECKRILSIPCHPGLTDVGQNKVIAEIKKYLGEK